MKGNLIRILALAAILFGISPAQAQSWWHPLFSPGMPADAYGTGGNWRFDFPADDPQQCPAADTQPPNFNISDCHAIDYFYRRPNCDNIPGCPVTSFSPGDTLTITFGLWNHDYIPWSQARIQNNTQFECNYPGAESGIWMFLEHTGDYYLNTPGYRWWTLKPLLVTNGTTHNYPNGIFTVQVKLDPSNFGCVIGSCPASEFYDTLANLDRYGFTFGGGCAKGHGNFIASGGPETFAVHHFSQ
jgi:hypothetical protein